MKRKNTEELYKFLGKKLKEIRTKRGFTRKEVVNCVDMPLRMLIAFESGIRQISAQQLVMMTRLYEITYEELTDTETVRKKLRLYRDLTDDEVEHVFDYECLELDLDRY